MEFSCCFSGRKLALPILVVALILFIGLDGQTINLSAQSNCQPGAELSCNFAREPVDELLSSPIARQQLDLSRNHLSKQELDNLPEITSSSNANNEEFFNKSHMIFHNNEKELKAHSIGDLLLSTLVTLVQSAAYSDIYVHRYDNYEDMRRASGPEVNNEQCIRQLENMAERVRRQDSDGYNSKDVNIHKIRDSWARQPISLLKGHLFVEGDYEECRALKLKLDQAEEADLRYCILSVRLKDWPQLDKHDILQIKAGVCIPRACDSLDHKNKYALIDEIAVKQLKLSDRKGIKTAGLYCLPDEQSSLRSIWHSPKTLATLTGLFIWVLLQVYATFKYNKLKNFKPEPPVGSAQRARLNLFRMLSISNNFNLLFDTSKESSLLESSNKSKQVDKEKKIEQTNEAEVASGPVKTIDLRCIEGIKVISMCYVIMGHVLMCMPTIMKNGRELAQQGVGSLAFLTANLVPAFAVNSFFAITGLLTSYLMFKQNQSQRVITSPAKWVAVIVYRYLRIMPMYALVVLYCKTLAKYTGSGPLWDYGTSSLSQRRVCEQESWRWTLTFSSNFAQPLELCIPGGWYLSNDFQFFLITPVYIALLHKRPQLGKFLLYFSIVASYLASFMSIYTAKVSDLRPIANFTPFGFKTYVSHLSFNYTQPQYRISAYLVGLLVGYKLYQFEENKRKYNQLEASERSNEPEPSWSATFKNYGAYLIALMVVAISVTPFVAAALPFSKTSARVAVALVNSSYHPLFATIVGLFIMLASTGYANKTVTCFLSANIWKPLARLSLCAVLINVEVINFIIQRQTTQIDINNTTHMLLNCVCIAATYLVSTVVCVLFEAPIRAGLNAILAALVGRLGKRAKVD